MLTVLEEVLTNGSWLWAETICIEESKSAISSSLPLLFGLLGRFVGFIVTIYRIGLTNVFYVSPAP